MENVTQLEKCTLLLSEATTIIRDLRPYFIDIGDLNELIKYLTNTRDVAKHLRTEQIKYIDKKRAGNE